MDENEDQEAARIGHDMALPALHFLARIIARWPAAFRRFDRLAVNHAGRRRYGTTFDFAQVHHQHRVDRVEQASVAPCVEITPHRRYRRKAFGQHLPRTSAHRDIEDRIDDLAHVGCPPASTALGWRDKRCRQIPLFVRHIRWIA